MLSELLPYAKFTCSLMGTEMCTIKIKGESKMEKPKIRRPRVAELDANGNRIRRGYLYTFHNNGNCMYAIVIFDNGDIRYFSDMKWLEVINVDETFW